MISVSRLSEPAGMPRPQSLLETEHMKREREAGREEERAGVNVNVTTGSTTSSLDNPTIYHKQVF